jgi:hypothetical protein
VGDVSENRSLQKRRDRSFPASIHGHYNLSLLKQLLESAPVNGVRTQKAQCRLALPFPDGSTQRFRIVESAIMAPDSCSISGNQNLAAAGTTIHRQRYGWISRQAGDYLLKADTVYIDPYSPENKHFISYYQRVLCPGKKPVLNARRCRH